MKALCVFPTVLDQMAKNLAWTSALGGAFHDQQADVMASIQRLRKQAQAAGNLKTTQPQTVTTKTRADSKSSSSSLRTRKWFMCRSTTRLWFMASLINRRSTERARWPPGSSRSESAWRWVLHPTMAAAGGNTNNRVGC